MSLLGPARYYGTTNINNGAIVEPRPFSSPLRNDVVIVPQRQRILPIGAAPANSTAAASVPGNSTASSTSSIGTGERSSKRAKKNGKGGTTRESAQQPGDMFKAILASYRDNDERSLRASEKAQQFKEKELSVKEKELSELARHNTRMEELERVRVAPFLFQAEQAEIDLVTNLEQSYLDVKTRYSIEKIAQIFPQLIQFFNPEDLSEEQRKRFSEVYNKNNESKGLSRRIDLTL